MELEQEQRGNLEAKPVGPTIQYIGNGVLDTYAYTFNIFELYDLIVTTEIDGNEIVETDYIVTGLDDDRARNVIFNIPPGPATLITIKRGK